MEWIFDGGRPCVDLVNTLRDRHLGGRELLVDPAALAEYLSLAGLLAHSLPTTGADLELARELREAIDRLTRGITNQSDVRLVNNAASAAPVPQLKIENGVPHQRPRSSARPATAALAELAVDAIDLVASRSEVRVCASDNCGLRFVDTSPKRNRQWCSMARCGNRAKARAHYARRSRSE